MQNAKANKTYLCSEAYFSIPVPVLLLINNSVENNTLKD
jgi:hypothetical protein